MSITNLLHVLLLIYLVSTSRPACCIHVPWCHTLNPTLHLHHPCMHYVYTMRNHVSWRHSISVLFLILLDSKPFQTTLDYSRPYDIMPCDFSHYRLIIYYCPIYILSKSVHTLLYYNTEVDGLRVFLSQEMDGND